MSEALRRSGWQPSRSERERFWGIGLAVGIAAALLTGIAQAQTGSPGGQMQPVASPANACFTIRSSREWKAIAAARPPRATNRGSAARKSASAPSSSFTARRKAWKGRVAGWIALGHALRGMAEATTSASFAVSVSVPRSCSKTIRRAMGLANRSSPRSRRMAESSFSSHSPSRSESGAPRDGSRLGRPSAD